jgi:hypothetical protein
MTKAEIATELDGMGVDRWHPFRADCEAIIEHTEHRRHDEAAEHLLRLAAQYRDRWSRNADAWVEFVMGLDKIVHDRGGALRVRMFRDACAKVARSRRLSKAEKRLERVPLL